MEFPILMQLKPEKQNGEGQLVVNFISEEKGHVVYKTSEYEAGEFGKDWVSALRTDTWEPYVEPNKKSFTKFDTAKPPMAILFDTSNALGEVAKVMEYGAEKYSRCNWQQVDDKERYISACMRHLAAYQNGETIDTQSGLPHLAHAITSLLFIQELELKEE